MKKPFNSVNEDSTKTTNKYQKKRQVESVVGAFNKYGMFV